MTKNKIKEVLEKDFITDMLKVKGDCSNLSVYKYSCDICHKLIKHKFDNQTVREMCLREDLIYKYLKEVALEYMTKEELFEILL